MHYNSKSKHVIHNIKVVRYAACKNVGKRATSVGMLRPPDFFNRLTVRKKTS